MTHINIELERSERSIIIILLNIYFRYKSLNQYRSDKL